MIRRRRHEAIPHGGPCICGGIIVCRDGMMVCVAQVGLDKERAIPFHSYVIDDSAHQTQLSLIQIGRASCRERVLMPV